ncbi:MAG: RecX family transcriptional regulator, partial [Oscillospiraceae bacterium]|nr:RecX family transcriptional regulator [Oscillospiraceae bacterium]
MNEYRLTSIKQTKKGRFALFFDEKFYFSIDEEILLKRHLKEDTIWSEEQIEDLKRLTDYNKAIEKAFQYLSIRQHSEKELFEKLERNYDEHTAAEIIERLKELNLLNDEEFASSYYQQMINRGKSIAEARAKLLQKGISKDIIDYVTIEFQPSEEDT